MADGLAHSAGQAARREPPGLSKSFASCRSEILRALATLKCAFDPLSARGSTALAAAAEARAHCIPPWSPLRGDLVPPAAAMHIKRADLSTGQTLERMMDRFWMGDLSR